MKTKSIELMNTTVALLVVFAFLFMFLGLSESLRKAEQENDPEPPSENPEPPVCPVCPPLPPDQPPIVVLSEAEGFSFATGKAEISPEFQSALREHIIPELIRLGREYRGNVIDCIGHTDEQRVFGVSNLDTTLLAHQNGTDASLVAGSNADLGLMRCWEVIQFLKRDGRLTRFTLYGYSAGQTVLPSGAIAQPGKEPRDDPTRRRIELRLRRSPEKSLAALHAVSMLTARDLSRELRNVPGASRNNRKRPAG